MKTTATKTFKPTIVEVSQVMPRESGARGKSVPLHHGSGLRATAHPGVGTTWAS